MSNERAKDMLQDLPDDVWTEIMEHESFSPDAFQVESGDDEVLTQMLMGNDPFSPSASQVKPEGALSSLSSTSKRMRRLAVPILYKTLTFKAPSKSSSTLFPSLIRSHMRARFFCHSPRLLQHVRKFKLDGWERITSLDDMTRRYFDPGVTRRNYTQFILWTEDSDDEMPMDGSSSNDVKNMIAGIYDSITCLIPHMDGLLQMELFGCKLTPYLYSTMYSRPRLTKLLVTAPPWKFWADIPVDSSRRLIMRGFGFYEYDAMFNARNNRADQALSDILRHDMTRLEVLHVCPVTPVSVIRISNLVHCLRYLHLDFVDSETPDFFYVFTSRKTEKTVPTPHHLLTLIESLSVFRNLERLGISYYFDMRWTEYVSVQVSWKTVLDLLGLLDRLHTCHIYNLYGDIDGYDIGCPVLQEGKPHSQGHPSLKSIAVGFLSNYVWTWNTESGWVQGKGSEVLCRTNWWDKEVM